MADVIYIVLALVFLALMGALRRRLRPAVGHDASGRHREQGEAIQT